MAMGLIASAASAALGGGQGGILGATASPPPSSNAAGGTARGGTINVGDGPSTGGGDMPPWFWPAVGIGAVALTVILMRR